MDAKPPPQQREVVAHGSVEVSAALGATLPPMNALEILRETVRILRRDAPTFLAILSLFVCPVSAALLSDVFVSRRLVDGLTWRLDLMAASSGLPLAHSVKQVVHRISAALLSVVSCFPLLLTSLLIARAAVTYSVACCYAGRRVLAVEFWMLVCRIWRRVLCTYLCVCGAILGCLGLFLFILIIVCNAFAVIGYPPEVVVYPALLTVLAFSVVYAHTIIVCNVAGVVSVLEERSGLGALLRSVNLVKGMMRTGIFIFLGSTIGTAFVQGLFEHRVKTLSYGDGSSRIWEGPLLVVMYSFVVLVDSMMSAVFYFTCRSSSMAEFDAIENSICES